MKLGSLIGSIGVKSVEGESVDVVGLTSDSREVKKGFLFCALSGSGTTGSSSSEGRDFALDAESRGAVCVVTEKKIDGLTIPQVIVENIKKNFGLMSSFFYGEPSDKLFLAGITGTNGKTTVAYLVESLFKEAGFNVGVMGTVEYRYGDVRVPAPFTTPQSPELQRILSDMATSGTTHIVMEVSSHGLAEFRVDGVRFGVKVFTNLTQDHLDYHKTMEEYFKAKSRLFTDFSLDSGMGYSVINIDDEFGARLASESVGKLITCSLNDLSATIHARSYDCSGDGIRADVSTPKGDIKVNSAFVGEHNLYNIMSAIAVGCSLDINASVIEKGINSLKGVRGRLMRVGLDSGKPFSLFVDYAHTPDALVRAVNTVSKFTEGRVITVFGCGGDRDVTKREPMGRAVAGLTDVAIITSDNPRREDPEAITKDIEVGMVGLEKFSRAEDIADKGYTVIVDRKTAIESAVSIAKVGDTILVAGKGHEDYQIVGTTKNHFDDVEVLEAAVLNS